MQDAYWMYDYHLSLEEIICMPVQWIVYSYALMATHACTKPQFGSHTPLENVLAFVP